MPGLEFSLEFVHIVVFKLDATWREEVGEVEHFAWDKGLIFQ